MAGTVSVSVFSQAFESAYGCPLYRDVIRMPITAIAIEGNYYLRFDALHNIDNSGGDARWMVLPLIAERIPVTRCFTTRHAAIAVAQHEYFFKLQELPSTLQLAQSQLGYRRKFSAQFFRHVADIAICGANQKNFNAFINPLRYGGAQAKTLIVRMRVANQQAPLFH